MPINNMNPEGLVKEIKIKNKIRLLETLERTALSG